MKHLQFPSLKLLPMLGKLAFFGSGQTTFFGTEGISPRYIKISDTDQDNLYVTVSSTGGTLSVDGTNYTSSIDIGAINDKKTIQEINNLLGTLSFKGTTKGTEKLRFL